MKLGTQIKFDDGRTATVVYNSLVGVGIMWGLHNPDPVDFKETDGNTVIDGAPANWPWEPEALLRDPWPGCERYGFAQDQCVGADFEVVKQGVDV